LSLAEMGDWVYLLFFDMAPVGPLEDFHACDPHR
jgi:hypothetical protein